MTNNLDWFRENFENIRIDFERVKYLEELQIAISTSNLSQPELAEIVSQLQLEIIFDCLNTTDKVQLELTIVLIKRFLSTLNPRDVIRLYGVQLGRALEHPDIEAKRLVLNELNRIASCFDLLTIITGEIPLLQSVVECVKSEDLSLASIAIRFLNELGKIDAGVQVLFTPPILDYLKQIATTNDTVRFRTYEIVVDISTYSIHGLIEAVNSNLLIELLNELQSNDILLKLASLETITKLALTDHGLEFLKEKQLLKYLDNQLENATSLDGLLIPGYIKFFGNVAQVKPQEIFSEYPSVINRIFQLFRTDDPVISNVILETVGYIGSTPSGKLALHQHDFQLREIIPVLGKMIISPTTECKIIALNVLANILYLELKDQTLETLAITKYWFSLLSDDPIKTIASVCEKPFKELKLAGLLVLHAVAAQTWGQEEINTCPGLVEYLLDRNEEGDMSCKAAKYKIVKTILGSPSARIIFSPEMMTNFQVHVRQGVIYVETKTEIAFEGVS